jgi:hypothetical protein
LRFTGYEGYGCEKQEAAEGQYNTDCSFMLAVEEEYRVNTDTDKHGEND